MMMLGSFDNALVIIKDVRIVWVAKTPLPPVYVTQSRFDNKDGLIVTLADNGFL